MALYSLKDSPYWWVTLVCPRTNQRIRRSSKLADKSKAKLFEEQLMASLVLGTHHYALAPKSIKHTWQQAAQRWLVETQAKKDHVKDQGKVARLNTIMGNKPLADVDSALIHEIFNTMCQRASPSTANRYLALISAILHRACNQWEWLDRVPHIKFYKETARRIRYLTQAEAKSLLLHLPPHLQAMALFTLNTGLRAANVTGLKWSQVDLKRGHVWINADEAKAKKPIAVPLNAASMHILNRLQADHETYVFTYKGQPVTRPNNHGWRHALKRAGIGDFRWHDLRHTWATWHIQAGTPVHVLQELGGWSSYEMVRRYAHLTSDHLKSYSQYVCLQAGEVGGAQGLPHTDLNE